MKRQLIAASTAISLAAGIPGAVAAAPAATPSTSVPPAAAPSQPVIDPTTELRGSALVEALRRGGYVLYMRHAQHKASSRECLHSDLAAEGESQARAVGAGLHALKIPVGEVLASESCRTQDTARLLDEGQASVTADLNPAGISPELRAALDAHLDSPPPPGTNRILVSHVQVSSRAEERIELAFAEIAVFRPGAGHAKPVARVKFDDWAALAQSATAAGGTR